MTDTVIESPTAPALHIRRATEADLEQVVDLDARVTGNAKPQYWRDIYERFGTRRASERFFLVAETDNEPPRILGFIAGEIREWEFGSEPCGWVFAVAVDPEQRQKRIGEHLFRDLCENFRRVGAGKVRTMVQHQNQLHMSFFRGEGMTAGPYIQLEMSLKDT